MVIECSLCVVCFDNVSWIYSDVVYLSLHITSLMCVGVMLCFGCGGVVSICRLKHYWPVHVECGGWGLMTIWTGGWFLLGSAPEWVCLLGGGIGYSIVRKARLSLGYFGVWVGSLYYSFGHIRVGFVECVGRMLTGEAANLCSLGWMDVKCVVVSVVVGFLYMSIYMCVLLLMIVRLRKLM